MSAKRRRYEARDRHVRLYHWLMNTAAWQSLNGNQRAIYIEMAARYAGAGSNNGKLHYSVREAADTLHIGKTTAARDLKILQERGFIVCEIAGGFNRKVRHASTWRLTEFPCDVKHTLSGSKEFARWCPEIHSTVPTQNSMGPVTGQYGTCRGTDVAKMSRNSTRSGTVKAVSFASRDL